MHMIDLATHDRHHVLPTWYTRYTSKRDEAMCWLQDTHEMSCLHDTHHHHRLGHHTYGDIPMIELVLFCNMARHAQKMEWVGSKDSA